MTWADERHNDSREQEQLDIAYALVIDATKDTSLWLQANPSAEEQVHVLAMQERLAGLARIIERRGERRSETGDDWRWSEAVREVLSGLLKAREARGGAVGESWDRLVKRLPRELPGSKSVTKRRPTLPAPIEPVNTSGGVGWSRPEPSQIPPDFPLYYPNELKPGTAVIRSEAAEKFPHQAQILELCKYFISKMTPLFREAAETGTMKAHEALGDSGMKGLVHSWLVYNCKHGNERYQLEQEVRRSAEWREFEKAIADAQRDSGGPERLRTGVKQAEQVEFPRTQHTAPRTWKYSLSETELNSREECEKLAKTLESDGAKNLKVYSGRWERVGSRGKIILSDGEKSLCTHAIPRELLKWLIARNSQRWEWPVVIEAKLPPPAMGETQGPRDYREEIARVRPYNETQGLLRFGEAWSSVRELAEIERQLPYTHTPIELHERREKLIQILFREYPEAAEKLRLPASESATKAQNNSTAAGGRTTGANQAEKAKLTDRKNERGKRCAQIVEEVKRFKFLRLDAGKPVSEIQSENPDFLVWKVRENLSSDDRELFDHPNRWGSVANYAYGLLSKEYAKSWTTIRDWVKDYRSSERTMPHHQGQ